MLIDDTRSHERREKYIEAVIADARYEVGGDIHECMECGAKTAKWEHTLFQDTPSRGFDDSQDCVRCAATGTFDVWEDLEREGYVDVSPTRCLVREELTSPPSTEEKHAMTETELAEREAKLAESERYWSKRYDDRDLGACPDCVRERRVPPGVVRDFEPPEWQLSSFHFVCNQHSAIWNPYDFDDGYDGLSPEEARESAREDRETWEGYGYHVVEPTLGVVLEPKPVLIY